MRVFMRMTDSFLAVIPAACFAGALRGLPATAHAARELTLEQALELASQRSPHLKASRHDVQSAEAQRRIAGAAFLPKVEASETFLNTNNPAQAFGTLLNQGRFTQADFNVINLNRPNAVENYRFQAARRPLCARIELPMLPFATLWGQMNLKPIAGAHGFDAGRRRKNPDRG